MRTRSVRSHRHIILHHWTGTHVSLYSLALACTAQTPHHWTGTGVSLTVTEVMADLSPPRFSVMLIAHTQKSITLPLKDTGDEVNIEVDVVAKYVHANLAALAPRAGVSSESAAAAVASRSPVRTSPSTHFASDAEGPWSQDAQADAQGSSTQGAAASAQVSLIVRRRWAKSHLLFPLC
jgi:hypothetical protein